MQHDDSRERGRIDEGQFEARLEALFHSIEGPAPSPGFAARTMRVVKREPLPPGRKPLRDPLTSLIGWSVLVAGGGALGLLIALTNPVVTAFFSRLVSGGVGAGTWLIRFTGTALAVIEALATAGLAVSRAATTREGATGLILVVAMAVLSLSALYRMLITEGEGASWQELS